MTGSKCADERELARHDGRRDDARETLCILSRVGGMRAPDPKHLKDRLLRGKNSTTTPTTMPPTLKSVQSLRLSLPPTLPPLLPIPCMS